MKWFQGLNPVKNNLVKRNVLDAKRQGIFNGIKGKIFFKEPLKNHTTFKIGGRAEFFAEPYDIEDLKLLLKRIKQYKMPFYILGAGSNVLVSDKGLKGVVIHLNSPCFKKLSYKGNLFEAGGAVMLRQLVARAQKYGLCGVEFLAGIPGTIGGALVMNAGIPEKNISDLVEEITVMDYNGNIKRLSKKNLKFGYRVSNLSRYIILNTRIRLVGKNKKAIQQCINEYLKKRRLTQDLAWPSAGCVFKNPKRNSAGRLIDCCGLKGKTMGQARISSKHANFIVNIKNARARDVAKLMSLARKKVRDKFGITLEPEIIRWQ